MATRASRPNGFERPGMLIVTRFTKEAERAFEKLKKAKREHDRALDHYIDLALPVRVTTGAGVIFVEVRAN